jgi:hypothetical protein
MSKPILKLAPKAAPKVPYSLLRKAVALFRSDLVPRSVRRANAMKWLASMAQLGDGHCHRGAKVNWSRPQVLKRPEK